VSKLLPKPKAPIPPPPPPTAPTSADASVIAAGQNVEQTGYSSLISTTPQGLSRKASTAKTSLIGGN
jgi:hypothetical protein